MPTGKTSPKYGKEYYVQLEGNEDSFVLWFQDKNKPEVGKSLEGTIEGSKFTKEKKEWKLQEDGNSDGQSGTSPRQARSFSKKDNSDGQRQGMCLNNAANYVNTLEFKQALTNREWSDLVHSYATSLYALGDLKAPEITPETVAGVFGGNW